MPQGTWVNRPEGVRILLIEDDDLQAEVIRRGLINGYCDVEVTRAGDAASALAMLEPDEEGIDDLPTFVVVDLGLPGVSGHEVLRSIRSEPRTSMLPVVVLSASEADADRVEAYQQGANSYLTKPSDGLQFREMLHDLVKYWSGWNQPMSLS